jgi:hypothetical protein
MLKYYAVRWGFTHCRRVAAFGMFSRRFRMSPVGRELPSPAVDPNPPVALAQSGRSLAKKQTFSGRGPRREAANEAVLAKVGFAPRIERAS